jgi:hypothetical protein
MSALSMPTLYKKRKKTLIKNHPGKVWNVTFVNSEFLISSSSKEEREEIDLCD